MAKEQPKALLFLDFDGVLNSDAYFAKNPDARGNGNLDPKAVARLCKFVTEADCHVVVSSSWREGRSLRELQEILVERGFIYPTRIIGKTAKIRGAPRGQEIRRFMKNFPACPFVVFDDDDDMDPVTHYLIQTDPRVGLSVKDVRRAHLLLEKQR